MNNIFYEMIFRRKSFHFFRNVGNESISIDELSAVIHNAFREGVHRVYAECDPRNTASWKLLESLGFRREAHFRQNVYFWKDADGSPIWKDTYVYAILESDESIRKDSKL